MVSGVQSQMGLMQKFLIQVFYHKKLKMMLKSLLPQIDTNYFALEIKQPFSDLALVTVLSNLILKFTCPV